MMRISILAYFVVMMTLSLNAQKGLKYEMLYQIDELPKQPSLNQFRCYQQGFFCKLELTPTQKKMALRTRLGTLDYVNTLEQKYNY